MENNQNVSKSFWPRHVSWLTILFAVLAVASFLMISSPGIRYGTMMGGSRGISTNTVYEGAIPPSPAYAPMMDGSVSNQGKGGADLYYPYPYQNPSVPVTDTREFLQVSYNASMRTRDVQGLTRRVVTTVRGHEGRIDQESSSEKYGYVSFAVPKSKYDVFRSELESLVGSRFLTTNISSQNLLPQKVSIEEQQKQADASLSDAKTARAKIVSTHTSAVAVLQSKINANTQRLAVLSAQTQTPQVQAEIQTVSNDQLFQKQQLANENASYTSQLNSADWNIKSAEEYVKAVQTQDKILLDNVATVTGTISIEWISLLGIILLYLPGYSIPGIFAVLAVLSFFNDRRRFGTR
jgi:hypothetical protein